MSTLTIGIPCYNEAFTIAKVVHDYRRVFPEARVLVIDNASDDDTAARAREAGAAVVRETRRGKGHAVQRLFQETDTDLLLMVDGDDTYPAEEAPRLIGTWQHEGGDTIVATRTSRDPAAFKAAHSWANDFLSRLIEGIFGAPAGDLFSGMRLFTKAFYRNVPLLATGFEIETEMALQTLDKCFLQRNVAIDFRARPEGSESKLNTLQDGARVLRTIFVIVKDYRPMFFFAVLAALFLLASLAAGIFPVLDFLRYRYVFHVPLAILASAFGTLAALSVACGIILDSIVRYRRAEFLVRMRNYRG